VDWVAWVNPKATLWIEVLGLSHIGADQPATCLKKLPLVYGA